MMMMMMMMTIMMVLMIARMVLEYFHFHLTHIVTLRFNSTSTLKK